MALIPDEAIESMDEVSPSAWKVYCLLCKFRSKESGESWPSHRTIEQVTGVHYTRIGEAKRQLIAAGWIEITRDGHCQLLKGFAKCKPQGLQNANDGVCKMQSEGLQNANSGFAKCKTPPIPPYRGGTSVLNQSREPERESRALPPSPQPSAQLEKSSSKPASESDASLSHPAIEIYQQVFGQLPRPNDRREICNRVVDLNQYRATLVEWDGKKWNPANVSGQLDRYEREVQSRTPETLPEALPTQTALALVPPQPLPTSSTLMQFGRPGTAAEFGKLPYVLQNAITEEVLEAKKKREDDEFFAQVAAKTLARKQQRMIENYGR